MPPHARQAGPHSSAFFLRFTHCPASLTDPSSGNILYLPPGADVVDVDEGPVPGVALVLLATVPDVAVALVFSSSYMPSVRCTMILGTKMSSSVPASHASNATAAQSLHTQQSTVARCTQCIGLGGGCVAVGGGVRAACALHLIMKKAMGVSYTKMASNTAKRVVCRLLAVQKEMYLPSL